MSIKVILGVNRKIGQPNYGSRGANCQVEFELAAPLDLDDASRFQTSVRQAYRACRLAVLQELQGESASRESGTNGVVQGNAVRMSRPEQNGDPTDSRSGRSTGPLPRPDRPATANQLNAIRIIASRYEVDVDSILQDQFGVSDTAKLTTRLASRLIERLQQIAADRNAAAHVATESGAVSRAVAS
jgi:hypothetical protein